MKHHVGWAIAAVCAACSAPVPELPPVLAPAGPPGSIDFAREGLKRLGSRGRIEVFERAGSDIVRIGAEGRIPAPPEQVLEALLDYPRHPGVISHVAEARPLERGEGWMLVYQRLTMPIISDRDFTLRLTWGEHADGSRWIAYRAVDAGPPPQEDVVRVTRNYGGWYLKSIEGGRATLARYQSNMDLAGAVPTWMSRGGAVDELPDLFGGLCELLELDAERCPG
jgi:hypothetical protein